MADDPGPVGHDLTGRSLGLGLAGRSLTALSKSSTFSLTLERTDTMLTIGKLKLRGKTDDLPQDWWFASTAIPLLAATIGPLANVLSIAALVSKWRVTLPDNGQLPGGTDDAGVDIPDPHWEIIFNAISLACGFFGNICLLLNFTRRIRYIIALPFTIISWYFATGILIALVVAMNEHDAPIRPGQTYSQGFWHAVIAACLYLIGSMILMVNMTGYFLGHYPQHFDLDDDQRTLILQTMMFFFWLAGGAAVFSKVCGFTYTDALYFCDVTVLTIGFGDIVAPNDAGRGLVFPYAVLGIIFLGLMINSIRKFAAGLSKDNIIKKHQLRDRERTFGRSVTSEKELRDRLGLPPRRESDARRPSNARKQSNANSLAARRASLDQYGHFDVHGRTITFHEHRAKGGGGRGGAGRAHKPKVPLSRDAKLQQRAQQKGAHAKRARHREKLILLKEEKDRFDMMREMQAHTSKFKQYYALSISVVTFGIVWCVGALVFMLAERRIQNITYFEALYFCYVSLLTIGYGDFSPKSNAGKPFFVVWSLVAIPTMTILVSEMGDTVVAAINRGTFTLADWTVMPKEGRWHDFLEAHPRLKEWLERRTKEREANKRIKHGFDLQNPDEEAGVNETNDPDPGLSQGKGLTLENLAEEPPAITEHDLARKLALAIKKTANDLRLPHHKKYSYEEWVEFTRLIRFSSKSAEEVEEDEEEEGLVEWDWIGEDSPMLADVSESEWILDRLCESLNRYTRKQALEAKELQHHRDQRDPDSAIEINSPIQLNENSQKRRKKYHESHIQTYPAHPGLRSPTTIRPSRSISPAVVRRDFHEEHLKRAHVLDGKRVDSGGSGSGSTTESGAFSGSTTLASKSSEKENQQFLEEDEEDEEEDVKKEEELEKALDSLEVREWAAKADKPRYGDNVDLRFVGGG